MRRGTNKSKTNKLIKKIRKEIPGVAIRTSLIVGYPKETEEDFKQLKEWVSKTKFDRLGIFTYSHEEDTYAHNLEDIVPKEVKKSDSGSKLNSLSPREIVSELDRFVVGQNKAKRAVAIALRNRWRRQALDNEMKDEV